MSEFPVNPQRQNPYENSNFRVKWDGRYIPAISRITPLLRSTQVISHRDGGDPDNLNLQPGDTTYSSVTLERGLTQDHSFENWANLVWKLGANLGSEVDLAKMRKDIAIELLNEAGQLVYAFKLYRCWPSEYQPLSELNAAVATDAIERIVLQCEGWERDTSVTEPVEP